MIYCKLNQLAWLPYIALITKILAVVGVDIMGESMDSVHSKINYSSLSMGVCIFQGELRNKSKNVDEVVVQPLASNDVVLNTQL